MAAYQSELAVITKAKDPCSYVMTVTDKSPKRFRFTLVAKLQNYALKYLLWRFPDKEVLAFLYQIIDSYNANIGKGLPMGNQSSQWFALYYLDRIDRIIKEKYKIKYYTRYMDDLILLSRTRNT